MTLSVIGLGTVADDGTGDTARSGGTKINANFAETYSRLGITQLALSTFSGCDATGATDSRSGVVAAFALVAGTGIRLVLDGKFKLTIGSDYTKPIFVPNGVDIIGNPGCYFISDQLAEGTFVFVNAKFCTWKHVHIEVVADFAANCIDVNSGIMSTQPTLFHNNTLTNYLVATQGNTFTSATALWSGPTPYVSIFNVRGLCSKLWFVDCKMFVPSTANQQSFIPFAVSSVPEWLPNTHVTASTTQDPTTSNSPSDVRWTQPVLDGFYMGYVGGAKIKIENPIFLRYSDIQDGTTGTVTFNGALSGGAGSGTLSGAVYPAGWALATGNYSLVFSNAQRIMCAMVAGSGTVNFATALSSGATATATSGNVGGVSNWMAPPHAIYMTSLNGWNYQLLVNGGFDYGIFVGMATRRSTLSGSTISVKFDAGQDSMVENFHSRRVEGLIDIQAFGNGGTGMVRGCSGVFDSSTPTANSAPLWGMRFPSGTAYTNLTISKCVLVDLNPAPTTMPLWPGVIGTSNNISIEVDQYMNDFTGTGSPTVAFAGTNVKIKVEIFLNQHSATQTFRGFIGNSSTGQGNNNFNIDVTVHGWRSIPVVFSTAPSGTSTTLSPVWGFSGGTYLLIFSTGERRYAAISGSSASWTGSLATSPTVNAVAQGALAVNFNGYKSRTGLGWQTAQGINGRARLYDSTNQYEAIAENALLIEHWAQQETFTCAAGTNSYPTHISIPANTAVDARGFLVNSNWGTTNNQAGMTVGWTGATSSFMGGLGVLTSTNPVSAGITDIAPAGKNLVVTATGSSGCTFDGTGCATLAARVRMTSMIA